ncbi:hypothetical protein OIU84_019060 [Salix udensis]|uniref:Uncharacterized protein n=1 Tax=Salix udensis TaxID=889485 RepID=A0AAD6KZV6_9ROSI|nr:hypothetical protein OIU84_019060 [Salix udensis]
MGIGDGIDEGALADSMPGIGSSKRGSFCTMIHNMVESFVNISLFRMVLGCDSRYQAAARVGTDRSAAAARCDTDRSFMPVRLLVAGQGDVPQRLWKTWMQNSSNV